MESKAEDIIGFWVDEVGIAGWYRQSPALDAEIRRRFEARWRDAKSGRLDCWLAKPRGALALLILLDQFPRNMFRDRASAFASDAHARHCAKRALALGHDLRIDGPPRQFFYMPLMHSELHTDQDRCVRLFLMRMPEARATNLPHARAHREIIRRYGRFPARNKALGRITTGPERDFMQGQGYGGLLQELTA